MGTKRSVLPSASAAIPASRLPVDDVLTGPEAGGAADDAVESTSEGGSRRGHAGVRERLHDYRAQLSLRRLRRREEREFQRVMSGAADSATVQFELNTIRHLRREAE